MKWTTWLFIGMVLIGGVCFRLWFISLAPQPFDYDQKEYEYFAIKMNNQPFFLASHTYRPYPWPLFLAILYNFVGWGNHQAVYFANAVMDAAVSCMLFFILYKTAKSSIIAWIGAGVYIFNPFTSGYVGTVLSENLSTFFIAATITSGVLTVLRPRWWTGALLGLLAGMAAQTRTAAFAWAALPMILPALWVPLKKNILVYVCIFFGFVLTLLHPMYVNWRDWGEPSVTTVDSIFAREFYNGAVIKVLPPFTKDYPVASLQMWYEYYSEFYPERTKKERDDLKKKYWDKTWEIIRADPIDYIQNRIFKMIYVWQKENIFFYEEPGFPKFRPVVFVINLLLLICTGVGFAVSWKIKSVAWKYAWTTSLWTVFYGTFAFSITHAEYRLTIPFYPLLILIAAPGILFLLQKIYPSYSGLQLRRSEKAD